MNQLRILLTGGTGFLGQYVYQDLIKNHKVTIASRGANASLKLDLTQWSSASDCGHLKGQFDALVHLAGLYDLRASESQLHIHNVIGTQMALIIAEKAEIPLFVNASSVAVAANQSKSTVISPYVLHFQKKFPDHYAFSKAHAEDLVRGWKGQFPTSFLNLRLGILVGDTMGNSILRIDGPYKSAKRLSELKKKIRALPGPILLPGNKNCRLPLIPVDVASRGICALIKDWVYEHWAGYRSYHLTPKRGLSAEKFYQSNFSALGIEKKIILMRFIPEDFSIEYAHWFGGFPKAELKYLFNLGRFSTDETEKILGPHWCPEFEDFEKAYWKGYFDYALSNC